MKQNSANKRIALKLLSVVLAVLMMASCLSVAAMAKENDQYKTYTALGDSAASGFGLTDYSRRGKLVLWNTRIKGSYPDLVAKELGVDKLYSYGVSGIRTTELRYLLDDSYSGDKILDKNMATFSDGGITRDILNQQRPKYQKAVKNADLITLDIGFDDIWIPTIACIYNIAEDGRYLDQDPELTVQQKIKKYGSTQVVIDNAVAYLLGFASNPVKWAHYWASWEQAIAKWVADYFINYGAIVRQIYKLNPDVTVLAMGCYNPCHNWGITVGDSAIEHVIQPYYDLLNTEKYRYTAVYDNYYYVNTRNVSLITEKTTIPLYENVTLDDSGFNPHPTAAGHRDLANRVLKTLEEVQK